MNTSQQILVSEDLTINPVTHQVTQKGHPIKLPELSYRTLVELLMQAPNTVSVDYLIDNVWQDIEVSPETVTQRIALLRKSLSANSQANNEYISSIRNQGYRWVPEVKSIDPNSIKKQQSFKLILIISIVSLLSVIYWVNENNNEKDSNSVIQTKSTQDEYLSQAWYYFKKHDLNSNQIAIELFRKSLASKANNTEAMIGISLALSHQVTKFNQANDLLNEAKELAQKAIDLSPENADAWVALGFMYDARGDIDKAIELYEKAIHLNSKDLSTKGSLAYLLSQKGRLLEAMQLNISIIGSKQPYLNLQIANTLELLGFESIAEIWYQKADELSPDNVFATHQRARFYISHGQNSKAKNVVESALKRGIQRPELYVILGILDWMNQDINQANLNFKKALEVNKNDLEANIWSYMTSPNIAATSTNNQQFEMDWFQEPANWPDEEVFKALYLIHNNRIDESIQSLESAYNKGYLNHRWLKNLPPFYPLLDNSKFISIIEKMQNDISKQKQLLLKADWLPISFLDPQKY
jgi:DNA-binding winged helix-turn-helix (wHTH) protein/Flp pilus assembly protein TadD